MGIDAIEAERKSRNRKPATVQSLEALAKEALDQATMAYEYVGNSYTYNAMNSIDNLVRRLKAETDRAKVEAESEEIDG